MRKLTESQRRKLEDREVERHKPKPRNLWLKLTEREEKEHVKRREKRLKKLGIKVTSKEKEKHGPTIFGISTSGYKRKQGLFRPKKYKPVEYKKAPKKRKKQSKFKKWLFG